MRVSRRTLFTAKELMGIANDEKKINDPRMLGRALSRMKFRQVCNGNPIHGVGKPLGGRASDRLWAIVDEDVADRYDAKRLASPEAACIYLNECKEYGALKKLRNDKPPVFPDWYKPLTAKL